jgi:hypothetical protein
VTARPHRSTRWIAAIVLRPGRLARVPAVDRTTLRAGLAVLRAGLAVRVAALVMLVYQTPIAWPTWPYPGWSALIVGALVAENLAVISWWLACGRITVRATVLDAGFGLLAVFAGTAAHAGLVFTHAVLLSFTLGLGARRPAVSLPAGLLWAGSWTAGSLLFEHARLLDVTLTALPSFAMGPLVGHLCARLFARADAEVDAARVATVASTAALTAAREQARQARALHDRALQTLEALSRGTASIDDSLREAVAEQAAWLRTFVDTGQVDQRDDLPSGLAAAVRAIARTGVRVQLNDAALRVDGSTGRLDRLTRQRLLEATHRAMASIAADQLVVRAAPERGGVLVTVLASGPAGPPGRDDVAELTRSLAEVGGDVAVDAVPCIELWVPCRTDRAGG